MEDHQESQLMRKKLSGPIFKFSHKLIVSNSLDSLATATWKNVQSIQAFDEQLKIASPE